MLPTQLPQTNNVSITDAFNKIKSGEDFIKEVVGTPTIAAVDESTQQQPQNNYVPPEQTDGNEPNFSGVDPEPKKDDKEKFQPSDDYKMKTVRYFLDMEENGTAFLCAAISGTKELDPFKYSDYQKEMLLHALEPYKDYIVSALPPWLPLMFIYLGFKADQTTTTIKHFHLNRRNNAASNNPMVAQKVAEAAKTDSPRKSYKIHKSGLRYLNDKDGQYVKDGDLDKHEKPDIADIEKIIEVNSPQLVCQTFNISIEDLKAKFPNAFENE